MIFFSLALSNVDLKHETQINLGLQHYNTNDTALEKDDIQRVT